MSRATHDRLLAPAVRERKRHERGPTVLRTERDADRAPFVVRWAIGPRPLLATGIVLVVAGGGHSAAQPSGLSVTPILGVRSGGVALSGGF